MRLALVSAFALAACASRPAQRVDLLPVPSATTAEDGVHEPLEEIACKPQSLVALEPLSTGGLDEGHLREALLAARDFAQRCCSGDDVGDATVLVTVDPEGYQTKVTVQPEALSSGPAGACIYATFHRLLVKAYSGTPITVSVAVHLH